MAQTVDARGLSCPQPVIRTRKAMDQGGEVLTIVDNETSQKNVSRMAEKSGAAVRAEQREDGIYLRITPSRAAEATAESAPAVASSDGSLVLVVPGELMGRGEHTELGDVLIRAFFHTLGEVKPLPDTIVFFNSGVKLVVEGSPVVEDLEMLVGRGVEILACGTCLGYYDVQDEIAVGTVSNMYTIAETMLTASRLVYL
ncbi:MAG: sulfurtransferase-like selenium metabolism protein YedF [Anaerolineae bacterium]|nr:sulfurtransferase-like selenium metabolism protein YedF [Anaerolineae bacterium]